MDFVVRVGVDGHQFVVTVEDKKLIQLQEQIALETKIDAKNQLLLSKKGIKVEDLSVFENDSQLQQTNQFQEHQKAYIIYVFDLSDSQELVNYPQTKFEPKMELKQLLLSEQARETLLNLNSNILNYEKQFFTHLQNIKGKYLPYQQKVKQFERVGSELENQVQSFEVLLKLSSFNYSQTKARKNEVIKKYKDTMDKSQPTLKRFDESIENLKRIELHPALQNEQQRCLSDIYFKPEAMYKWKNSCINSSNAIKGKIDKLSQQIKKLKVKIKEERNTTITTCINAYRQHQSQFQQFIQESKALISSVVQSTVDEYNTLRQHMLNFASDINDEPALFYLSQFELSSEQLRQFEEAVQHLGEHLDKVNKSIEVFTKLKSTNTVQLINVYKVIRNFLKEFDQVNDKLKQSDDEIEKMDKDFSYLLSPQQLPQAYQQALCETSRRREFRDVFDKKLKSLISIVDIEKEKRKKFLQQFGRILPQDFIGQLKNLTPQIQVSNAYADVELPNITGLHTDKYSNKVKPDNNLEQLKQQIEDLTLQCKQTHDFYQNKTPKKQGAYVELLNLTAKNAMKMFIQRSESRILAQVDQNELKQKENDMKMQNLKQDYSESITQCKQDLERLRSRCAKFEQDFQAKQQEVDAKSQQYIELSQRCDQLEAIIKQRDASLARNKEELNKYATKCENFENQLTVKSQEMQKQLQSYNKEKSAQMEQISQAKQQYQEVCKKLQGYQLNQDQLENRVKELEIANATYLQQVQDFARQAQGAQNESERLRQKLKLAETDRENKQLELEKQIQSYNQLLEGFVEKSEMLKELGSNQGELAEKEGEFREQIKALNNKIDNMEIVIQQKNGEINQLRGQINNSLLVELQSYEQKNKELARQVEILNGQIGGLNQKFDGNNLIDIAKSKLLLTDPQFTFDLSTVKAGQNSIFVPAQPGVYVPLVLKNIQSANLSEDLSTQSEILNQRQYRVKLDSLPNNYRDLIAETGLIFVAQITELQETEEQTVISVGAPSYVIGFEESENVMKNFIV